MLADHLAELPPVVYDTTVGEAIKRYSDEYRRPRGIFPSIDRPDDISKRSSDPGHLRQVLPPEQDTAEAGAKHVFAPGGKHSVGNHSVRKHSVYGAVAVAMTRLPLLIGLLVRVASTWSLATAITLAARRRPSEVSDRRRLPAYRGDTGIHHRDLRRSDCP